MLNTLKVVAKLFFIIISKIFIIQNMNRSETLITSQQQIAVDDKILHYIKRKIVTTLKRIKTGTLKRKAPFPYGVHSKHL